LIPWARIGLAKKEANDPETGKKLWEWLEEQVADL
jgi:retinol dehydrogenase 12